MTKDEKALGLDYYKAVLSVQMHFNDMLLRTRTLGLTAVVSLLAISGTTMTQTPRYVEILFAKIHIAGVFGLSGLLLSLLLFALDRMYYYRLLLGAVDITASFEQQNAVMFTEVGVFSDPLTTALSKCVSRRRSSALLHVFWLFPAGLCAALVIFSSSIV